MHELVYQLCHVVPGGVLVGAAYLAPTSLTCTVRAEASAGRKVVRIPPLDLTKEGVVGIKAVLRVKIISGAVGACPVSIVVKVSEGEGDILRYVTGT